MTSEAKKSALGRFHSDWKFLVSPVCGTEAPDVTGCLRSSAWPYSVFDRIVMNTVCNGTGGCHWSEAVLLLEGLKDQIHPVIPGGSISIQSLLTSWG